MVRLLGAAGPLADELVVGTAVCARPQAVSRPHVIAMIASLGRLMSFPIRASTSLVVTPTCA